MATHYKGTGDSDTLVRWIERERRYYGTPSNDPWPTPNEAMTHNKQHAAG
ncbi:hypothetical protein [Streptomyces sp. NPDC050804]